MILAALYMDAIRWHTCVIDPDYEICDSYPHNIRRIGSTRNISVAVDTDGYCYCHLNRKKYRYHRIIATQFTGWVVIRLASHDQNHIVLLH